MQWLKQFCKPFFNFQASVSIRPWWSATSEKLQWQSKILKYTYITECHESNPNLQNKSQGSEPTKSLWQWPMPINTIPSIYAALTSILNFWRPRLEFQHLVVYILRATSFDALLLASIRVGARQAVCVLCGPLHWASEIICIVLQPAWLVNGFLCDGNYILIIAKVKHKTCMHLN